MADILPNEKNLLTRRDYGVRVARPGFNAQNCAENQLLFNSSWPIMQIVGIYKEVLVEQDGDEPVGATPDYTVSESFDYCASDKGRVITRYTIDYYYQTGGTVIVTKWYGARHNLGFPPLAFPSSQLSNKEGYIVITNIDISTDVDYPYTEAPLSYFGGTLNYGIKSRAYYMNEMPQLGKVDGYGINSKISSKMVQSVKTLDTAQEVEIDGNNYKFVTWQPPEDSNGKPIFNLSEYEFFAFGRPDNEYGVQYPSDLYVPQMALYYPSGLKVSEATMVSVRSPQTTIEYDPASLVVLRSPMISPEIMEVEYDGTE